MLVLSRGSVKSTFVFDGFCVFVFFMIFGAMEKSMFFENFFAHGNSNRESCGAGIFFPVISVAARSFLDY